MRRKLAIISILLIIVFFLFTVSCGRSSQNADTPKKVGQYEQFKIGDIISVEDYKISITEATGTEVLRPKIGYKWVVVNVKAEAIKDNYPELPIFTLEDEEGNVYLPFNDIDDEKDYYDVVFEVPERMTDFKLVIEPSFRSLLSKDEWKGVIPIKLK